MNHLISHRGNLNGPNPERENTISYIEEALQEGFDVEVDIRVIDNKCYLGHDETQEEVSFKFLSSLSLWVHAKNIEAVEAIRVWNRHNISTQIHYFWHETDHMTLTSLGIPWVYPGKGIPSGGIAVMPETAKDWELAKAGGICSDHIKDYHKLLIEMYK